MVFALAVLDSANGALPTLHVDGKYYLLDNVVPGLVKDPSRGLLDVLEHWDVAELALLAAVADGIAGKAKPLPAAGERRFLPLLIYPPKLVCNGANYYDHLRLDGGITDFDKTKYDVMFFLKHSRALVGSGNKVRYPSHSAQFDWEVELAVIFGKRGRRIAEADAMSYVAGYAVGIDLTVRDWQNNSRHFMKFDIVTGKSFDDSAPLGPHFVPARFVDPTDLTLKLTVNGEVRQDSHTREMIFSVPEQVAALSQHMTIEPGDVLFTGTPAGVGWRTGDKYLKIGDRVEAEIGGLGKLSVEVAPDPEAQASVPAPVPIPRGQAR